MHTEYNAELCFFFFLQYICLELADVKNNGLLHLVKNVEITSVAHSVQDVLVTEESAV